MKTQEENSERYGDCCEVSYELIEEDKQKAVEESRQKVREVIVNWHKRNPQFVGPINEILTELGMEVV